MGCVQNELERTLPWPGFQRGNCVIVVAPEQRAGALWHRGLRAPASSTNRLAGSSEKGDRSGQIQQSVCRRATHLSR
jgi:hypothetical protein